jgi:SWI/SNF-related matrix-associated actin-dependent regulator of chromatin subfamily B protein 1
MNTLHISKLSLLKQPNNQNEFDQQLLNSEGIMQQGIAVQSNCQPNLQMVPIKIDLELEGRRYKDLFLWDKNEPYLTLESFVKILIEEQNLPAVFENELISTIKKQINQFRQYKQMDGELLKILQINVRIGNIVLRDQFEWDINNPHNSPEDFAESLCQDLGLDPEFMLPIAH